MKSYTYRVAYFYEIDGQHGSGATTVTRNKPIQYGDDFAGIQDCIAKDNCFGKVAVFNIMRIKGLYRPVKILKGDAK